MFLSFLANLLIGLLVITGGVGRLAFAKVLTCCGIDLLPQKIRPDFGFCVALAQLAWFPVAMRRGSACLLLFLALAWPKRNSQSLVAWHGFPERHWKAHGRVPALRSFYGDSVPVPPPGHPDYPVGAEVQPFANQNGGVDDTIAPPRLYMSHGCTWEVFAQPSEASAWG